MSFYHALKLFRRLYIRLKLWCHCWFKSAFYKQYFCNLTACITGQNGAVKSIMEIYLLFKVTANHIGFCIAWVDFTHPKIFAVFRRGVNSVSPSINYRAFAQEIRIHVRNGLVSGSVAKHSGVRFSMARIFEIWYVVRPPKFAGANRISAPLRTCSLEISGNHRSKHIWTPIFIPSTSKTGFSFPLSNSFFSKSER